MVHAMSGFQPSPSRHKKIKKFDWREIDKRKDAQKQINFRKRQTLAVCF